MSAKRINTRKHTTRKHAKIPGEMPSKEDILAFVADNPGRAGKREIARHFGIIGGARIHLKKMLKDLADDGLIEKRNKRMIRPGDLPPVFVVNIAERNDDGDSLGTPIDWDTEAGTAPKILILSGKTKATQPGLSDRALVRLSEKATSSEVEHSARVIRVLEKRQGAVLGIFRQRSGERPPYLEPIDRKQRELDIDPSDTKESSDGDLVSVQVTRSGRYGNPLASIVERFGSLNSEMAISEIALQTHGIPHHFPAAVIAQAESAQPIEQLGEREDWRNIPLITIDPPDAKDHDDAVFAEADQDPDNRDGFIVYVAIADVAHYVTPGSAMDREANLRGNSVYFPDRVIPMLPERISNQLCSLREKEDKPALAVRMVFDKTGTKKSHSFHRILMRSAAKLSYLQAQKAIDGSTDEKTETLLEGILRPLWDAYGALLKGRAARKPLELDLPERKIKLKEDGTVDHVYVPERLDAHKLIEEFMIQANVAAAETLERKKSPLLYRVHDASSPEKLENLKEFLATLSIKLPSSGGLRPSNFNGILAKVKDTPQAHLVNEVVLRSQAQAEYTPQNIGHFGLNLRRYAHFTSPIRRYADLIVHRSLVSSLKLGKDGLQEGIEAKLEAIGAEISAAERRAMVAERETIDRLIALWMSDQIGASFHGRIAGVVKSGIFVRLSETGADGFVPASTIGDEYFRYDEGSHALIGDKSGITYQLGDQVEVKLVEVAPYAGSLTFELLSNGRISGKPVRKNASRKGRDSQKGKRGKASAKKKGRRRS